MALPLLLPRPFPCWLVSAIHPCHPLLTQRAGLGANTDIYSIFLFHGALDNICANNGETAAMIMVTCAEIAAAHTSVGTAKRPLLSTPPHHPRCSSCLPSHLILMVSM